MRSLFPSAGIGPSRALLCLLATLLLAPVPAAAQRVSLIWDGDSNDDFDEETGEGFTGVSPDVQQRRMMLEQFGFLTRVDNPNNNQSWWDTYSATPLFEVVYVTGEADTDALADKLRAVPKGIVYETPQMDAAFGLTDSAGTSNDETHAQIDTNAHPVTAGLAVGNAGLYTAVNPISMLQGTHAPSLQVLGSNDGPAALAVVEAGGTLANTIDSNSTATARRVRLPFGAAGTDWRETTTTTHELLEQSIEWAATPYYSPTKAEGVCVMLTEDSGVLNEQETWRVRRLAYEGWTVVLLWDGDTQANYDAAIATADVVYVPANTDATAIGDKLREVTCGVVSEKSEMNIALGFADSAGSIASGSGMRIVDRAHGVTGNYGLNSTIYFFYQHNYDANNWPRINQPLGRLQGTLAPDLRVLGTSWNLPTLVALDTGDELVNTVGSNDTAAGRRVRLPWVEGSDVRYMISWANGHLLLAQSLRWAAGTQSGTLVAHYKLDETAGATAADSSGNGYDGQYNGSVTLGVTPAQRNVAANFDTAGEHVYAAPNAEFENLGADNADYTIAFWLRPGELSHTNWRNLFHLGGANYNDRAPLIMLHPTNRQMHCWFSSTIHPSGVGSWSGFVVDDNQWNHIVVVKSGSYLRWYKDGQFRRAEREGSESIASAGHLRIGRQSWWGEPDGDLDDVRVYSYALTDTEILGLYETLVLHYKFEETSGNTATDSSVFANDGTYTGSPTLGVDGAIGEAAAEFDGSTSYLRVPAADQLDMTQTLTIAAWVNVDDFDNADGIFSRGDDGEQPYALRLRADRRIQWRSNHSMDTPGTSPVGQTFLSTGQLTASQWAHVGATWDGSHVRLYINGALDSTHALTGTVGVTTEDSAIGSDIVDADEWFDGRMDDLRVYNRALTESEMFELGGGGLRLRLKLDETSGTIAEDSGPYAHDGTYVNAPTLGGDAIIKRGVTFNDADLDDRLDLPHEVVDGLTEITVAWWMRTDYTGQQAVLSGANSSITAANEILVQFENATRFVPCDNHTFGYYTIDSIADDRWHHYAYQRDLSTKIERFFIDGEAVVDTIRSHSSNTLDIDPGGLMIGQEQDSVGGGFDASQTLRADLDDFRIYGRVLSAEEVAELYGLVGHWRFDEIAGDDTAYDETVFQGDGEYVNSPILEEESPYPSEDVRTAVRFEQNEYAVLPYDDHLRLGQDNADFSIAFWLQNNRVPDGNWRAIVQKHLDNYQRTPSIWLRPWDNRLHPRVSTSGTWSTGIESVSSFDPGVWRHVVFLKEDSQLRLYVDGVLERSGNLSHEVLSNRGSFFVGSGRLYNRGDSTIDDFRVYNRALNDWEIAELHGLVGWYRMEDLAGTTVTDSSGIENHGVVVGATPDWPLDAAEGSGSLELDGTNYVAIPKTPLGTSGMAASGWVKLDTADAGGSELISLADRFGIRVDESYGERGIKAFGYNGSGWTTAKTGRYVAQSGWTHIAASYRDDIQELSVYINGVQTAMETLPANLVPPSPEALITLGRHPTNSSYDFNGMMDDVRLYNRPITRTEARSLFYGEPTPGLRIVKWVEVANP